MNFSEQMKKNDWEEKRWSNEGPHNEWSMEVELFQSNHKHQLVLTLLITWGNESSNN